MQQQSQQGTLLQVNKMASQGVSKRASSHFLNNSNHQYNLNYKLKQTKNDIISTTNQQADQQQATQGNNLKVRIGSTPKSYSQYQQKIAQQKNQQKQKSQQKVYNLSQVDQSSTTINGSQYYRDQWYQQQQSNGLKTSKYGFQHKGQFKPPLNMNSSQQESNKSQQQSNNAKYQQKSYMHQIGQYNQGKKAGGQQTTTSKQQFAAQNSNNVKNSSNFSIQQPQIVSNSTLQQNRDIMPKGAKKEYQQQTIAISSNVQSLELISSKNDLHDFTSSHIVQNSQDISNMINNQQQNLLIVSKQNSKSKQSLNQAASNKNLVSSGQHQQQSIIKNSTTSCLLQQQFQQVNNNEIAKNSDDSTGGLLNNNHNGTYVAMTTDKDHLEEDIILQNTKMYTSNAVNHNKLFNNHQQNNHKGHTALKTSSNGPPLQNPLQNSIGLSKQNSSNFQQQSKKAKQSVQQKNNQQYKTPILLSSTNSHNNDHKTTQHKTQQKHTQQKQLTSSIKQNTANDLSSHKSHHQYQQSKREIPPSSNNQLMYLNEEEQNLKNQLMQVPLLETNETKDDRNKDHLMVQENDPILQQILPQDPILIQNYNSNFQQNLQKIQNFSNDLKQIQLQQEQDQQKSMTQSQTKTFTQSQTDQTTNLQNHKAMLQKSQQYRNAQSVKSQNQLGSMNFNQMGFLNRHFQQSEMYRSKEGDKEEVQDITQIADDDVVQHTINKNHNLSQNSENDSQMITEENNNQSLNIQNVKLNQQKHKKKQFTSIQVSSNFHQELQQEQNHSESEEDNEGNVEQTECSVNIQPNQNQENNQTEDVDIDDIELQDNTTNRNKITTQQMRVQSRSRSRSNSPSKTHKNNIDSKDTSITKKQLVGAIQISSNFQEKNDEDSSKKMFNIRNQKRFLLQQFEENTQNLKANFNLQSSSGSQQNMLKQFNNHLHKDSLQGTIDQQINIQEINMLDEDTNNDEKTVNQNDSEYQSQQKMQENITLQRPDKFDLSKKFNRTQQLNTKQNTMLRSTGTAASQHSNNNNGKQTQEKKNMTQKMMLNSQKLNQGTINAAKGAMLSTQQNNMRSINGSSTQQQRARSHQPVKLRHAPEIKDLIIKNQELKVLKVSQITSHLQVINLTNNKIRILPQEIGSLLFLETLAVDTNQLKTLPQTIKNLRLLKKLSASNNYLKVLPRHIEDLTDLEILIVNNNDIQQLPPNLGRLFKLKVLYLHFNQLRHVPSSLQRLSNLTEFSLEWLTYNNPPIYNIVKNEQGKIIIDQFRAFCSEASQYFSDPNEVSKRPYVSFGDFIVYYYDMYSIINKGECLNEQTLNGQNRDTLKDQFKSVQSVFSDRFNTKVQFGAKNRSLLHQLCISGDEHLLKEILFPNQLPKFESDTDQNLNYSELNCMPSISSRKINQSMDINYTDTDGRTALHLAIEKQKPQAIVRLLLDYACQDGDDEKDQIGGDDDNYQIVQNTEELLLASPKNKEYVIKQLNVDLPCPQNGYPLFRLIYKQHLTIALQFLDDFKANPHIKNSSESNIMHVLLENFDCDLISAKQLLYKFANQNVKLNHLNNYLLSPLHMAVKNNQVKAIECCHKYNQDSGSYNQFDFNVRGKKGNTPLHYSILRNNQEAFCAIIQGSQSSKVDVIARDDFHRTPRQVSLINSPFYKVLYKHERNIVKSIKKDIDREKRLNNQLQQDMMMLRQNQSMKSIVKQPTIQNSVGNINLLKKFNTNSSTNNINDIQSSKNVNNKLGSGGQLFQMQNNNLRQSSEANLVRQNFKQLNQNQNQLASSHSNIPVVSPHLWEVRSVGGINNNTQKLMHVNNSISQNVLSQDGNNNNLNQPILILPQQNYQDDLKTVDGANGNLITSTTLVQHKLMTLKDLRKQQKLTQPQANQTSSLMSTTLQNLQQNINQMHPPSTWHIQPHTTTSVQNHSSNLQPQNLHLYHAMMHKHQRNNVLMGNNLQKHPTTVYNGGGGNTQMINKQASQVSVSTNFNNFQNTGPVSSKNNYYMNRNYNSPLKDQFLQPIQNQQSAQFQFYKTSKTATTYTSHNHQFNQAQAQAQQQSNLLLQQNQSNKYRQSSVNS